MCKTVCQLGYTIAYNVRRVANLTPILSIERRQLLAEIKTQVYEIIPYTGISYT